MPDGACAGKGGEQWNGLLLLPQRRTSAACVPQPSALLVIHQRPATLLMATNTVDPLALMGAQPRGQTALGRPP